MKAGFCFDQGMIGTALARKEPWSFGAPFVVVHFRSGVTMATTIYNSLQQKGYRFSGEPTEAVSSIDWETIQQNNNGVARLRFDFGSMACNNFGFDFIFLFSVA